MSRPAVPRIVVHPDAETLAAASAARLVTALLDAQATTGHASVVLTGGGIGISLLAAVRRSPAHRALDWGAVDVWWGDERFVPDGDEQRNDRQARDALLDGLPLDPARVHPFPSTDTAGSVEQAAASYAEDLARASGQPGGVPGFDVLLLGIGPEGHTGSVFPHSPALAASGTVVGVHDCPKPPPERITLTLPALCQARQVWFVVSGESKAEAVAGAVVGGADPADLPAAGVHGQEGTWWLLDRAAAGRLQRPTA